MYLSEDEVFGFLDELRKSGVTNMFGAVPFILERFPNIQRQEASQLLGKWMKTFGERHPQ